MRDQSIENRANFDLIRYAQAWEDAEILLKALQGKAGRRFLSIAAAGDNVLALLLLDPENIVAADLSQEQLYCLKIRIAAMRQLKYDEFIELMEPLPSNRRQAIARDIISSLDEDAQQFWNNNLSAVSRLGLAGIGRFEHYFSLFRRFILPLIATRKTCELLLEKMTRSERVAYYDKRWNNWRWRLATRLFFSQKMMGKHGRDPAFFDFVEGDLPAQIRAKVRHAIIELEPHENPYMQWILLGQHRYMLPVAWRESNYQVITQRLDRITILHGPVQEAKGLFDGYNLSDIFEYMSPELSRKIYSALLSKANPHARFVYWNMMVRREMAQYFPDKTRAADLEAAQLEGQDKAFFYSALVIEDVVA